MKLNLVLLLLGVAVSSCKDGGSPTNTILGLSTSYSYASYDSVGTRIVEGWFTLDIADSNHISGEWHFVKVGEANGVDLQVGAGNLVGGFQSGLLWIELHPQFRDANLQLLGTLTTNGYTGTWQAIGIMGIFNHGSFQARPL